MSELVVIGGGPGGTAAATRASQLGAKVTLVEKDRLGGRCVNQNCIPMSAMMASVSLLERIRRAGNLGVQVAGLKFDLSQARARARQIADELATGTEALLNSFGVEVIQGEAQILGPGKVQVGERQLTCDALVLASGAQLSQPPFPVEGLLDPQQALTLERPPDSLLIWGAEAVEVQFAQYFALLGSKVTLIAEGANILPDEDYEVGQRLQTILADCGVQVLTGASLHSTSLQDRTFQAVVSQRKGDTMLEVERVLWAKSKPLTAGLGLEVLGLKFQDGAVWVDDRCQTSQPGIYAVGDLAGKPMYSYVATQQGLVAAENATGGHRRLDLRAMPRCIYTIPEAACVGLTEFEAEDQGFDVEIANISLENNVRAMTLDEAVGGIKVVFDRKYGKLLGVHIVGHRATDLIAEAALAIQLEALAEDFAWSLRGHPTMCESMVEAGRAFHGQALYIPKW